MPLSTPLTTGVIYKSYWVQHYEGEEFFKWQEFLTFLKRVQKKPVKTRRGRRDYSQLVAVMVPWQVLMKVVVDGGAESAMELTRSDIKPTPSQID